MTPPVKRIVVAEDDEDDAEMFQSAADHVCPDLELTVATDGVKLINILNSIPQPDIIVLDLNMPRKSGKECLQEIRSHDKFDEVPIVILSTSSHSTDINFCLNNGANDYFVKPHSFAGMKNLVSNLCNGVISSTQWLRPNRVG